ncbi:hypothetical protein [Cypionkella sp.]|uniref:hypothetical protein n=1 Tax=Cypionkella sp. TaxID=2811411 RepID=UPI0026124DDA|nr:hypothetical protein [Cypionkella sp.]MDB5666252.1 hypothetical protein [Cypionkella sp.]
MLINPAARFMLAAALFCLPQMGLAERKPLSAISWLSQSVKTPTPKGSVAKAPLAPPKSVSAPTALNGTQANLPPVANEPKVTTDALPDAVATTVLGGTSLDAVGLLPPMVTGFPHDLWGIGHSAEIAADIAEAGQGDVPALQSLLMTLLLAEAEAPADSEGSGDLLIARVDKLLTMGALDQAQALIDAAGAASSPDLFRRSFDVALLTGNEDHACEVLKAAPGLAPTLTTRVFCLARAGDWNAAALTLRTAQALGNITADEDLLLSRFLDPEQFDGEDMPPAPKPITPLVWRIYDALGEPLPTATLPPAFAHADLSEHAGWKAQIEAAERLSRAGAITPNVLLGLYTDRAPAASGGVWDRADAFQRFDAALSKGDVAAIEQRLPLAYARMRDVEVEVPFATLFAGPLAKLHLTGDAARISYEMGLLSPEYERLAKSPDAATDARSLFLAGLAAGSVKGLLAPDSMARAIAPAFTDPQLPDDIAELIAQKRVGEAMLQAMIRIESGVRGELVKVTEGLSVLRKLGLEDIARRTALQLMLLERRG